MNNYMPNNQFYGRTNMYNQPLYGQPMYGQITQNQQTQPVSQIMQQPMGIQGKSVDSIEVVKAMDIPLDGSVSYFPLVDGTAIVTKQLQQDGTSKITIFKPIEAEEATSVKYATIEDIENRINGIKMPDMKPLQDEIKTLKKQIRILLDKEE